MTEPVTKTHNPYGWAFGLMFLWNVGWRLAVIAAGVAVLVLWFFV